MPPPTSDPDMLHFLLSPWYRFLGIWFSHLVVYLLTAACVGLSDVWLPRWAAYLVATAAMAYMGLVIKKKIEG